MTIAVEEGLQYPGHGWTDIRRQIRNLRGVRIAAFMRVDGVEQLWMPVGGQRNVGVVATHLTPWPATNHSPRHVVQNPTPGRCDTYSVTS